MLQLLNNIIITIISIRGRKEIADVCMSMITRICRAINAAFNAPNCPKKGTTHSKIGLFEFSGVFLSTPLAPTSFFSFLLPVLEHPLSHSSASAHSS